MRRVVQSARETAELPPDVVFYVDDDDHQSLHVARELGTSVHVGPRIVLSQMWNLAANLAIHQIIMHCGDDIVFRTRGWDRIVLDEFERWPDRLVLVHGRDGFQDAQLATHGFYHRVWIETFGYLVPPYFVSDYNDLWNPEVADSAGRRIYKPEIYTEHMHPVAGKAELDQTHRERLTRHANEGADRAWLDHANERQADKERLAKAIAEFVGVRA
jgi:hypothetical protein